ncbi:hypothetical protein ACFOGJ_26090 [Marinibaculum pumilum]|uniref:Uncharacterized protein n=1 Tax=Marinibaculum pumilum TaxID=1766165 RepID=A0ABV7L8Y4_9PROT
MTALAKPYRTEELGTGRLDIFPIPAEETVLLKAFEEIFRNHWSEIHFGYLVQGAAFEAKAPGPPQRIGVMKGYLTVDFGAWHFHVCIGAYKDKDPELSRIRPTARAELYRTLKADDTPGSWGLRLFNGRGEHQFQVFLPHPFLSPDQQIEAEPSWERLALWDKLRARLLGLAPDPVDRAATGVRH